MKVIRQLRNLFEIDQKTLSEKAGLSRSYLSELETGKKKPSIEVTTKIAKVFDLRISQFEWIKENSVTVIDVANNYKIIKEATDFKESN